MTRLTWLLPVLLFAALSAFYAWSYRSGETAAQNACARATAEAIAEHEQKLRQNYEQQMEAADQQVRLLRLERAELLVRQQILNRRIDDVTQTYRSTPESEPQPLPACHFTDGFVRLYNQSISAALALPEADTAPGVDGETGTATLTEADELALSALQQSDILHHITAYGARCQSIEAQLVSLIDYLKQHNERTP
ncbi:MAG: hypothetical protein ACK4L8_10880 [Nitrincola lacisaponensis]|uniref:hypothetical protein n=1 Tax=Nitrincola lacisaponensis TaxID=267850 RepID=UPI00391931EE